MREKTKKKKKRKASLLEDIIKIFKTDTKRIWKALKTLALFLSNFFLHIVNCVTNFVKWSRIFLSTCVRSICKVLKKIWKSYIFLPLILFLILTAVYIIFKEWFIILANSINFTIEKLDYGVLIAIYIGICTFAIPYAVFLAKEIKSNNEPFRAEIFTRSSWIVYLISFELIGFFGIIYLTDKGYYAYMIILISLLTIIVFLKILVLFKDGEKFKKLYNKKVYSSIDRIVATELEYAERNDDLFRKKDTYSNIDFNPFRFNNGLKNAKKYLIQSSKKGIIENISQKRLRQLDHLIAETMKKINDNKTYSLNYRKTSKELKRKISCQVKVRNLCGYNVNSETIIGEVYFVFDASDKKIESKINKLKKVIENSVKKKL